MFRATINELEYIMFQQVDQLSIQHLADIFFIFSQKHKVKHSRVPVAETNDLRQSIDKKTVELLDSMQAKLAEIKGEFRMLDISVALKVFYALRNLLDPLINQTNAQRMIEIEDISHESIVPF
jgi:hypothetical protein